MLLQPENQWSNLFHYPIHHLGQKYINPSPQIDSSQIKKIKKSILDDNLKLGKIKLDFLKPLSNVLKAGLNFYLKVRGRGLLRGAAIYDQQKCCHCVFIKEKWMCFCQPNIWCTTNTISSIFIPTSKFTPMTLFLLFLKLNIFLFYS